MLARMRTRELIHSHKLTFNIVTFKYVLFVQRFVIRDGCDGDGRRTVRARITPISLANNAGDGNGVVVFTMVFYKFCTVMSPEKSLFSGVVAPLERRLW